MYKQIKQYSALTIFLWFGICNTVEAAHIIGGEITYECIGGDTYRFTMNVYRDCDGGGACFDSQDIAGCPQNNSALGTVSIYNNGIEVENVILPSPVVSPVLPNLSNPCLSSPPNVCVEEGVYVFTVTLPQSNSPYTIAYQRCCRNVTITNLVQPEEAGATYTIDLLPEAMDVCNSSPVFNDFPPIVICNGVDVNFDHSATDPDGDSLVYSFCTPFLGGGNDTQNATILTGVAPDPDAPPPYNGVPFINPTYSFDNPMGGNPQVDIDPETGLISGVPVITGQFVVGVCVEEYRDGELLSTVRRDFQFNVASCSPTVFADIEETELLQVNDQEVYVVRSCGDLNVDFFNESGLLSNIISQEWVFITEPGDPPTVISSFDALDVPFPDIGIYDGFLEINPGLPCNDTALIQVEIFPALDAEFSFDYDTCVSGPVQFTDLSTADAGPDAITDWNWSFGDGNGSIEQNPAHLYMIPGELPVTLTITDINNCQNSETIEIPYFPVPNQIVLGPEEFTACNPATVFFDNLSFPIDSTYDITWDFGDGNTSGAISPTHIYEDAGTYEVTLNIVSPIGCQTDTSFGNLITILQSPVAGFSFLPENPSSIEPTVTFTDESIEAEFWNWQFGNFGTSTLPSPVFEFPDTGLILVSQVVTHESGCRDTATVLLDIFPEVRYFLPNAFTPNGDGSNDGFRGNGIMEGATDFRLTIWNRYGELLFETDDYTEAWNGRKNNTGRLSEQGNYLVVVTFTGPRNEKFELKAFATLIK